jgi:hypothetical protein
LTGSGSDSEVQTNADVLRLQKVNVAEEKERRERRREVESDRQS